MSMNTLEIKVTMVERSRTYCNAVGYLKFFPDVRVDDSRRAGICQHADRANNGNTGGQRDDGTARATNGDDSDDFTVDILVTSTVTAMTKEGEVTNAAGNVKRSVADIHGDRGGDVVCRRHVDLRRSVADIHGDRGGDVDFFTCGRRFVDSASFFFRVSVR